jgi:hypothetical protein
MFFKMRIAGPKSKFFKLFEKLVRPLVRGQFPFLRKEQSVKWQQQSIYRVGIIFPWVRYKADIPDKQAQIRRMSPSTGLLFQKIPNLLGKT